MSGSLTSAQKTVMNGSAFSSDVMDWATPPDFFAKMHAEFNFDIDVCAHAGNAKLPRYWTEADDCLKQDWAPLRCWMNPPYGRAIKKFMAKAVVEAQKGALVVALVPARTDTNWWHDCVIATGAEVRFVRGRLRFVVPGKALDNAPFPSAVVVLRPTKLRSSGPLFDFGEVAA